MDKWCSLFGRLILTIGAVSLYPSIGAAAELSAFPEAFRQASPEVQVDIRSSGHLVLLSPVREVNDEVRAETMVRLPVRGEGRMYQLPRDANREQAREHYLSLLQQQGAKILFQCSGVSCGRSVVWANRIFDQATLNGRDSEQSYLAAGTLEPDGTRWLTLVYTVTRGNLREYVWVEHLKVGDGAVVPGFEAGADRISGPLIVPWKGGVTYQFDWQSTDRQQIREQAGTDGATVVLVGFSALEDNETLDQSVERARAATETLSEVLARIGVGRDQQRLIVVGPTVSIDDPERQGNRIEISVITR